MEENEVCELIRSVIMSEKGGVLLKNLNRDFISLAGEPIPYEKLGYKSIEELLRIIPDVIRSVDRNGEIIYNSKGKNCEHLANLISRQKSSKSKSSNHVVSHQKHTVSHHHNGRSGSHPGKKTACRNSVVKEDRCTRANQHLKNPVEEKHIPKKKDISATGWKLGLEPGSGAKIDLPPLIRSHGGLRKSIPDRILRESCVFNDCVTDHNKIPPSVSSRRLTWNGDRSPFKYPEKSPRVCRDSSQYSERARSKPEIDLPSNLSYHHNRDLASWKMKSDNFHVNRHNHHKLTRPQGRFSYDPHDSECHGRLDIPSNSCDNDSKYDWNNDEESTWTLGDSRMNYAARKFDFVSGILRVTIKNS